jgi:hypothetical protein
MIAAFDIVGRHQVDLAPAAETVIIPMRPSVGFPR